MDSEKEVKLFNEDDALKRGMKSRHLAMIAIGGTIGSTLFLGLGDIVRTAGPFGADAFVAGWGDGDAPVHSRTRGAAAFVAEPALGLKDVSPLPFLCHLPYPRPGIRHHDPDDRHVRVDLYCEPDSFSGRFSRLVRIAEDYWQRFVKESNITG